MDIKLMDGRYAASPVGGLATVRGSEELAQRVVMKLTARRGGFAILPKYGSRLHSLLRVRASERNTACRQFVAEALSDERDLTLDSLELGEVDAGGKIEIDLRFLYRNEFLSVSTKVVLSQ